MSDMIEVKRLLEEQGRAWEEFKKANDTRVEKLEKSQATSDFDAKLAKLNEAMDDVKSRADEALKKAQRPAAGGSEDKLEIEAKAFRDLPVRRGGALDTEGYVAYKSAFGAFLRARGVMEQLSGEQRKAMSAGIDPDGGYLLSTPAMLSVVTKVREMSAIRGVAGQISISTNAAEGLVDRGDAAASWVTEVATRAATTTPTVGKDRIDTFEIYSFPQVSQTLVEDSAVDVEAWLTDKVSVAFAEAEDAAFVTGDGTSKPRGITAYTTATTADATRTWGQLQHVISGANGAFHTTKGDPLMDLIAAFKPGYLANANWLTARACLAAIRKLKEATSDRYLWEPSMQAGVPSMLLGYPVVLDENMPAYTTTGALGLALGDFRRGYLIVDRVGISVLRDPYSNKPYVGLYVRKRVGGAVRDFDAIKFISFTA